MNLDVRDWLPTDAFAGNAAKDALRDPVAEWSAAWFARAAAFVSRVREDGAAQRAAQGLVIEGSHVVLELGGPGRGHLLEAMLGVNPGEQISTENDQRLLDAVATEAAADLVARLDALLADGTDVGGDAWLRVTVSIGRNELLGITISAAALVPLIKKRLRPLRTSGPALRSRAKAMGKTPITLKGCLGWAELHLSELDALGVGDVLVLDRLLQEPLELRLGDKLFARGKLLRTADQVSIQL